MVDYYFKFEFTSVHNTVKNMNYYVLAETIDDLKLFLSQHNFYDVPPESISIYPKHKMDNYEGNLVLEEYRFKSNNSPEILTVMTCWKFVEEAISNIASDLNQYMLFGEAIVRRDVEIFKLIGDYISSLDHAHIIDFTLCDIDDDIADGVLTNEKINELTRKYKQIIGSPTEDADMAIVYDSIFDSVNDNACVLPITIECYISNFTEMMMDAFE